MNKTRVLIALQRAQKTVSFALLFKSMVGLGALTLGLFGYTVPYFGIEPTLANGGAAAGAGAILGAILALKA